MNHEVTCNSRSNPHDGLDGVSPIAGLSERATRVGAVLVTAFVTLGAGLMFAMLIG